MHCSREAQEYWSGEPIPSPADLPDPGIEPESPTLQADTLPSEPLGKSTHYLGLAQLVKNPPAMQETLVQFLGQEDLLEKG